MPQPEVKSAHLRLAFKPEKLNEFEMVAMTYAAYIFLKIFMVCIFSCMGLMAGAFVLYFIAAFVYIAVYGGGSPANSYECARGNVVAYLAIFAGAIAGACLGAYAGYRFYQLDRERGQG